MAGDGPVAPAAPPADTDGAVGVAAERHPASTRATAERTSAHRQLGSGSVVPVIRTMGGLSSRSVCRSSVGQLARLLGLLAHNASTYVDETAILGAAAGS